VSSTTVVATLVSLLLLISADLALLLLTHVPAEAQGSTVPMVTAGGYDTVGLKLETVLVF